MEGEVKKPIEEEKNKGGRPTKYKEEYCQELLDFFNREPYKITKEYIHYKNGDEKEKEIEVANELPFFTQFARSIGVCKDTLNEWCKVHEKFSDAYKEAKEIQKAFLINNALRGLYNPTFSIFTAKNITSMRDKIEQEHSGKVIITGYEKLTDQELHDEAKKRESNPKIEN